MTLIKKRTSNKGKQANCINGYISKYTTAREGGCTCINQITTLLTGLNYCSANTWHIYLKRLCFIHMLIMFVVAGSCRLTTTFTVGN